MFLYLRFIFDVPLLKDYLMINHSEEPNLTI